MTSRILVIDDTEEILELYREILEDEGYEVELFTTVPGNLTDIEHLHPDLIILDLVIGQQQLGWRLLQQAITYAPTASLPFILCTAFPDITDEQKEYVHQKGIPIVVKPFDIDGFLNAVHHALP